MDRWDYVIVGAGSAGCVLASRLTEDAGVRVLVLEAGGRDSSVFMHMPLGWRRIWRGPAHNWNYQSAPDPNLNDRRLGLPRGKVLGGSSSINGMLYVRGHPRDYDIWGQSGAEGWSYATVLPYFKRAESNWRGETEFHGGSGPLGVSRTDLDHLGYDLVRETAENAGLSMTDDFAGARPEGFGVVDLTIKGGRRASAARMYLHPAMSRPNLTVTTGALTRRVTVENGRATGVEYEHEGEVRTASAAREVILCGGSYNSPQLLLLSGIGPPEEIAAHGIAPVHPLPGVGKNLQEHAIVAVQFAVNEPITFLSQLRFDRVVLAALKWQLFGTGYLATQALTALAFVRSRPELERPDLQLFFNPVAMDAKVWFPLVRPSPGHTLEGYATLLHPDSRGELTLDSPDPAAPPRIFLNLLNADEDRATLARGVRMLRQIYATPPLGEKLGRETFPGAEIASDTELDAFVRSTAEIVHHPVGTCTMGQGPMAVVDSQLRVRGLKGLRVVDASVMPTVPGGNTNAPTIMIAERAADLIRGRPTLAPSEVQWEDVARTAQPH
jgi:choline dehydrogenase